MVIEHREVGRITFSVLFITGLLVASVWILLPFLPAILWAATLVIATWPVLQGVQRRTGNRRSLAVAIMTLSLMLIIILPFWLAISTLIANIHVIGDLSQFLRTAQIPPLPDWVGQIPLIGTGIAQAWGKLVAAGTSGLLSHLTPYTATATRWVASAAGSLGGALVHLLLTTAIAAVLYSKGEEAAATVILFGRRLAGDRGERAIELAGQAVRSVALGVVVTALVQSLIGGIGLWMVGTPLAGLLAAVMFLLCLVQLGPALVLVPVVVWQYHTGDATWGTILLVLTILAGTIDQLIRPVLIRRGANLSLLLILPGVVGGLIAFGILGIFVGPTVLAVAQTLLLAWIREPAKVALRVA